MQQEKVSITGGGEEWECSEICGILHSSMPIVVESVSTEKFLQ